MSENVNPFLSARDETARAAEDSLGGYTSDSRDELDDLELEEEKVTPGSHRSGAKDSESGNRMPPMMMGGAGGSQAASARAAAGTTQQAGITPDAGLGTGAAGVGGATPGVLAGGGVAAGAAGVGIAGRAGGGKGQNGPGAGNSGAGISGPIPGMAPGFSGGSYTHGAAGASGGVQIPGVNAPAGTGLAGVGGTMAASESQGSGWRTNSNGVPASFAPGSGFAGAGYGANGYGAAGSASGIGGQHGINAAFQGPTRTPVAGGNTRGMGVGPEGQHGFTANPQDAGYNAINQSSGVPQATPYGNSGTNTGVSGSSFASPRGSNGYTGGSGSTGEATVIDFDRGRVVNQASAWDQWSGELEAIHSQLAATRASSSDFGNVAKAAADYERTQANLGNVTSEGCAHFNDFANALLDTAETFEEAEQLNVGSAHRTLGGVGRGSGGANIQHIE